MNASLGSWMIKKQFYRFHLSQLMITRLMMNIINKWINASNSRGSTSPWLKLKSWMFSLYIYVSYIWILFISPNRISSACAVKKGEQTSFSCPVQSFSSASVSLHTRWCFDSLWILVSRSEIFDENKSWLGIQNSTVLASLFSDG